MELILASQSPRRQELLRLITPHFSIYPADVDETLRPQADLSQEVMRLATDKAQAVADLHPHAAVIGSDTLVVCDGCALGKPADHEQARQMLGQLSGRTHVVLTGLALVIPNQPIQTAVTETKVQFAHLDADEIAAYIASGEPLDKAGAYGIQGLGARFIEQIAGDYYSVMGLPVHDLYKLLRHAGII